MAGPRASAGPLWGASNMGLTVMSEHILTILAVADLARAHAFYREAFPLWRLQEDAPVYREFALPGGQRLGLYQREGFARNTGVMPQEHSGGTTATELYLRCADIEEAVVRVRGAGGRELAPLAHRPWGDDVAYFTDPDGNVLALASQRA